jgi:hypothetical protein
MRSRSIWFATACIGLMLAGSSCRSERRNTALESAVDREVVRLDALLKQLNNGAMPAGLKPLASQYRTELDAVKASEVPELKLYRLRNPHIGIETLRFVTTHAGALNSLAAFEEVWQAESDEFGALDRVEGTALQRGLYQSAANRAQILSRASLPYGRSSSPGDGLFYLGEAEGNRQFAQFVSTLPEASEEETPSPSAISSALDALELQALAAFEREPSGRTTIPVSVRMKESRELQARGWDDGATLLLLEARLELSRRDAASRGKYASGDERNGSLETLLHALARDKAASVAVKNDVAPLFQSLFAPVSDDTQALAPVVVTLVRWPYT